jgi:hypothetical protein
MNYELSFRKFARGGFLRLRLGLNAEERLKNTVKKPRLDGIGGDIETIDDETE